jgi:[acyl-carrier-protein] S-malonyltransferase
VITKCLAAAVCVKNYNLDEKDYIIGAILPYQQLAKLLYEVKEAQAEASSLEQMHKALKLLQKIFITKKVTPKEQKTRFEHVLQGTGIQSLRNTYIENPIEELQIK